MRLRFLVISSITGVAVPGELAGYLGTFDAEVVIVDWRPEGAEQGEELSERLREAQPCDAIIIVTAPGSGGLREVVEAVRETLGDIPVIVSGAGEDPGADLIFTGPVEALPFALGTFGFRMRRKRVRREE